MTKPAPEERPAAGDRAQEKQVIGDRKLGDEWTDWNGNLEASAVSLDEDRRVFIGFAFLCLAAMILAAVFVSYMIYPRLAGWHHLLAELTMLLLAVFSLALVLWFAAFALPLVFGKRPRLRLDFVQKSLNLLVPLTIGLGSRFGISRDRMGNSFIKVSNALVRSARINTGQGPLLMLLPRCLTGPVRKEVQALAGRYDCLVHTVPGGELARQLIRQHRPSRIIAVACERDLVSGIQDVSAVVPTYAIPNCRPEGPCKNTLVDLRRIEEALILFSPQKNR
ncbi:MAG: DUF116 domain-containing protein [Candidatus Glassbacteria bacterium]|nr:DUF116 domain-containing protein [Candidatus Glassbacteria bacterium]